MMMTLFLGAQRYEMPLNAVGKFNSKGDTPFQKRPSWSSVEALLPHISPSYSTSQISNPFLSTAIKRLSTMIATLGVVGHFGASWSKKWTKNIVPFLHKKVILNAFTSCCRRMFYFFGTFRRLSIFLWALLRTYLVRGFILSSFCIWFLTLVGHKAPKNTRYQIFKKNLIYDS